MHQYQQGENGQPVEIQELQANVSSLNSEKNILQTNIQPYHLILRIFPMAIPAKLWTATLLEVRIFIFGLL